MYLEKSPLESVRNHAPITIPCVLQDLSKISFIQAEETPCNAEILQEFHLLPHSHVVRAKKGASQSSSPLRIGVFFSGGPAPGGHNVLAGLFDSLQKLSEHSVLIGFLRGPEGILKQEYKKLTQEEIDSYRNTGGFDLLGTGRTKIETKAQMQLALNTCQCLDLNGLIVIGGDDSNTNAALLASFFLEKNCTTRVIGIPKTIDGDLKNSFVGISFGFDTACRIYSEMIGNICRDAKSAGSYTHFIKLMGRSASLVTLECALATHPNYALIAEEVKQDQKTLAIIVKELTDLIADRAAAGKHYGVILVPEGLIEFIPEISVLIRELNSLLSMGEPSSSFEIIAKLSSASRRCFESLPETTQKQLLLRRDPHGNVQVSLIETEKLLAELVSKELEQRRRNGTFEGSFHYRTHFLGYEGRAGFPSVFDTTYCYALGITACLLVARGFSGYMAFISHLERPALEWEPAAVPLASLLHMEERKGIHKPVIKKALVDCKEKAFLYFAKQRDSWKMQDLYRVTGPMQFSEELGKPEAFPISFALEHLYR